MIFSLSTRIRQSKAGKSDILKKMPALKKTVEKVMMFLWEKGKPFSVQEMLGNL